MVSFRKDEKKIWYVLQIGEISSWYRWFWMEENWDNRRRIVGFGYNKVIGRGNCRGGRRIWIREGEWRKIKEGKRRERKWTKINNRIEGRVKRRIRINRRKRFEWNRLI